MAVHAVLLNRKWGARRKQVFDTQDTIDSSTGFMTFRAIAPLYRA